MLAIAITLPVVRLESPRIGRDDDLAGAYAALAPQYTAYALSVVVIGLYWAHSHFCDKLLRKTDHGYNLLTVLFLALVSVTPFPAEPFVEHVGDGRNAHTGAAVYALLLAAPGVAWLVRWHYAVGCGLLDPRLAPDYVRHLSRRYALTAATLAAGTALSALVDWRLGMGLCAAMTLSYLAPPTAPRFRPGQEPEHELEEADEQRD